MGILFVSWDDDCLDWLWNVWLCVLFFVPLIFQEKMQLISSVWSVWCMTVSIFTMLSKHYLGFGYFLVAWDVCSNAWEGSRDFFSPSNFKKMQLVALVFINCRNVMETMSCFFLFHKKGTLLRLFSLNWCNVMENCSCILVLKPYSEDFQQFDMISKFWQLQD